MMRCMFAALAAASLLALPTSLEAGSWTWNEVGPDEARISLFSGEMSPEGAEQGMGRNTGKTFHGEYAWWGFNTGLYDIQAAFWWAGDYGGWEYGTGFNFFKDFRLLDDPRIKEEATRGPTISTVIGDIGTWAFDVDSTFEAAADGTRQCLGFGYPWVYRIFGDWKHHQKLLSFYACGDGGDPMPETTFRYLLSGLAIEGEFEALVETN